MTPMFHLHARRLFNAASNNSCNSLSTAATTTCRRQQPAAATSVSSNQRRCLPRWPVVKRPFQTRDFGVLRRGFSRSVSELQSGFLYLTLFRNDLQFIDTPCIQWLS
ncbi:uncharacterized protein LOC129875501 [Solanum dulcamara]|uniref:uncharacterized protein LOC129875501 n=1 Tax=Solanum dulcamara TaxID=45834 RepID=UPI0024853741|nr:uncharacterized protein LOC129875501 [Solanum dulcamara]